jgi:hypothetical protein
VQRAAGSDCAAPRSGGADDERDALFGAWDAYVEGGPYAQCDASDGGQAIVYFRGPAAIQMAGRFVMCERSEAAGAPAGALLDEPPPAKSEHVAL